MPDTDVLAEITALLQQVTEKITTEIPMSEARHNAVVAVGRCRSWLVVALDPEAPAPIASNGARPLPEP